MEVSPNLMNYLKAVRATHLGIRIRILLTNPFLLHVLGMWSVIYNITSPHRGSDDIIYFLRTEINLFPIEDEIVSRGPQICCDFPAEKDEGEYVTVLSNSKQIVTGLEFSEEVEPLLTFALHSPKNLLGS